MWKCHKKLLFFILQIHTKNHKTGWILPYIDSEL